MQGTDAQTILKQIESLPPLKQQEVADFISFLHSQAPAVETEKQRDLPCRLAEEAFCRNLEGSPGYGRWS